MRSSQSHPSAFTHAFLGLFSESDGATLRALGEALFSTTLLEFGPQDRQLSTRQEVAAAVLDVLTAAGNLRSFGEFLGDSEPPEDGPLLELAVQCGRATSAAVGPLQTALEADSVAVARMAMSRAAASLRCLIGELDTARAALRGDDNEQAELEGHLAFVVLQRLSPAVADLELTADPVADGGSSADD